MGQYKKHFYGSTLYGPLPAFFGQWRTEVFDAEEPFTQKVEATIRCLLPYATYKPDSYETELKGSWTISNGQATSGATTDTFIFKAAGRQFTFNYKYQKTAAQTIRLVLKKEDGTVVATKEASTYSLTQTTGSVIFDAVPFALYTVEGSIVSGTAPFIFSTFVVHSSEVGIEIRTSKDAQTWSEWEEVTLSHTQQADKAWTLKGTTTTKYSGVRYSQGRITMLTSEETSAPVVERIELLAGDSGTRSEDGRWEGTFNMNLIASAAGKEFKRAAKIKWQAIEPENTTMFIRSASSPIGEFYGAITAPYRKNTKRLRLKDGALSHSVTIGPIDPSKKQPFWKTLEWQGWDDISFLPKDETETKVNYVFSKTSKNIKDPVNLLQEIGQPMKDETHKLLFRPQPFYMTVEMERTRLKGTPVVDLVDLYSLMEYKEVKAIENKNVSGVDNNNEGWTVLQSIKDTVYKEPVVTGENPYNTQSIQKVPVKYILEDKTKRPTDVILYLESEKTKAAKSNTTINKNEKIYAQAFIRHPELGETKGVLKHYQYSGGSVQYLRPHTHEMEPTFTPALDQNKLYRYFVLDGWPTEYHKVVKGDTFADIANSYGVATTELEKLNPKALKDENGQLVTGQSLAIPNYTYNKEVVIDFSNGTNYTEKSSHNARLQKNPDLSSDNLIAKVANSPAHQYVDWVSEEKIYNGTINSNDIRDAYIRTQYNRVSSSSLERTYEVQTNDTWEKIAKKFDIHVDDLKQANEHVEWGIGKTLVIPPNILLPEIPPGVEFDGSFPYVMTIVENSVQKKDGTVLDESWLPIDWNGKHKPLTATYRTSEPVTVEIKRGEILNDKDVLPHAGVNKILHVENLVGTIYQEWDNDLKVGDFKLVEGYIDWSPVGSGTREPAKGETYKVTYTHSEIEKVTVHLDSTYEEETGTDIVWRSPEVKVLDSVCTPEQDILLKLPAKESFEGYGGRGIEDYAYIVEDNDLWVETSVVEKEDGAYMLGTMKSRNPRYNWHPLINTGHYYLREDEYYLYSESLVTPLTEKEIPVAKNIDYEKTPKDMGIVLMPKRTNYIKNSTLNNKAMKTAVKFSFKK